MLRVTIWPLPYGPFGVTVRQPVSRRLRPARSVQSRRIVFPRPAQPRDALNVNRSSVSVVTEAVIARGVTLTTPAVNFPSATAPQARDPGDCRTREERHDCRITGDSSPA